MPTLPVPFSAIHETVEMFHRALDEGYPSEGGRGVRSATTHAAAELGLSANNGPRMIQDRLNIATALGVHVRNWGAVDHDFAARTLLRYRAYDAEYQAAESRLTRPGQARPGAPRGGMPPTGQRAGAAQPSRAADSKAAVKAARNPRDAGTHTVTKRDDNDVAVGWAPAPDPDAYIDQIVPLLRRRPHSIAEIAEALKIPEDVAYEAADRANGRGMNMNYRSGKWHLDATPPTGTQRPNERVLVTDSEGYLEFAGCADQHLCSKYERLDCLNDYYDHVQRRGISIVLNGGNWIDGESSFNKHDLLVHGCDQQLQYMAEHYPQREGVETWAIAGEDHEGWWSRREGVDIGRYAENVMRQAGRTDWHNMGFMECFIPVVHGDTGKSSQLCLMHPGGGSAYAISYAPQKIVEGFDGGAKPAVLLIGHYHKSSYQMTRNVHVTQLGCFQDQSLFMRQKKLAAHLGGWFFKLHVDPATGAVDEFTGTFRNYFVKDFYAGRWSEHGPVNHVPRSAKP